MLNLTCSHTGYFYDSVLSYLHRVSVCRNFATIISVKTENSDKKKLFQKNYSFSAKGKMWYMWSSNFSN